MSRLYELDTTLDVGGDEADYRVRCHVMVEPSRSFGWEASLDGHPEVLVDGRWIDLEEVCTDPVSVHRVEEWLCDAALEDDR